MDTRERGWRNMDTKAAKLGNLLVEAEDLLKILNEYQKSNNECHLELDDMAKEIEELRAKYIEFIDNNLEMVEL